MPNGLWYQPRALHDSAAGRDFATDRYGYPREPLLRLRGTCPVGSFRLTRG
jgi:hypothetical protein